jgi:lipopolysaccharide transport system ATP-binding protein
MERAVEVHALTKCFQVYARTRDVLLEFLTRQKRHTEFRALDDVTFDIPRGEVVGVIGRNGAGKSTLLKLIAGTLEPTSGTCRVNGRLSAILELGTGFHADYTGRENAYLGAICLGATRKEARARLDSIIDFAELGEFADRPFRTYSSGMQARLTFATAVATIPEVLIVDEALSVGDARFQVRCFDRIRQMRDEGCTILFVSHSMEQVSSLCDRVLLLEKGQLFEYGSVPTVTRQYQRLLDATTDAAGAVAKISDEAARADGTGDWKVEPAQIFDVSGHVVDTLVPRTRYEIRFRATGSKTVEGIRLQFHVRNRNGVVVYGRDPRTLLPPGFVAHAGETLEFRIRFTCHFGGPYFLASYGLGYADGRYIDFRHDALELRVETSPDLQHASIVDLDSEVVCERIERGG